jgi:predicted flap endonuclease-1-like 5' DNA nuclease
MRKPGRKESGMFSSAERWWWLILGILIGWVVGWVIEILYWRWKRRTQADRVDRELSECHDRVATLQRELESARSQAPLAAATVPSAGIPAQNLAAIRGIGPVFEQRLYDAGIGTFSQLAALSDPQVRAIIQPEDWQEYDYETWNEQSRAMAEKTGTVGATWNGIVPDDLSAIGGIGETYEQKLFDAGILTFGDLASASEELLQQIIQPEEWQALDLAGWIARAETLAQGDQT